MRVAPGGFSAAHIDQGRHAFAILEGQGCLTVDGQPLDFRTGRYRESTARVLACAASPRNGTAGVSRDLRSVPGAAGATDSAPMAPAG
ncbi:hypothetical protein ACTMU2_14650 [Cupriavidus basilensis]